MDEQLATKPTILLVDDEESILNSLRRLLRGQPFDVVLAGGGAQALEIMAAQPIDLVMSDARMPGMDGAQLLAEVHRLYPTTSRILLTGYADVPTIIKVPCKTKPVAVMVRPVQKIMSFSTAFPTLNSSPTRMRPR